MARDGDVPTIFNPKRVRTPSVIITTDEVASDHGDVERERPNGPPTPLSPRAPLTPQSSVSSAPPLTTQPSLQQAYSESAGSSQDEDRRDRKNENSCCSKVAKKIYYGLCVTATIVAAWVTVTHCIKYMYLQNYSHTDSSMSTESSINNNFTSRIRTHHHFNAPFFTAWFCTNWLILFYPLYLIIMLIHKKCKSANTIVSDAFTDFKDKGFTFGKHKLIVAAILCDTGIALLAYMDGITGSSTLGGVVLAACAAAGFAIFKVLFRKVMGEVNTGQRALFFSILGIVNATLLWPVCLALYLTGSEQLPAHQMPWIPLLLASVALLVFHLVFQFGNLMTYNIFVSLGLITAVPISGTLDVILYGVEFEGMKLAGIILITVGFFLVMFPDNWPDYIMRLLSRAGEIAAYKCQIEVNKKIRKVKPQWRSLYSQPINEGELADGADGGNAVQRTVGVVETRWTTALATSGRIYARPPAASGDRPIRTHNNPPTRRIFWDPTNDCQ
ncbi:jg14241 [Pararge aegeria aegeria]|uniref:Jg14241 protein n=1 Tax=Pararge aegeria aegeria TaxID=348720 RepID=A0A8S4RSD2_9NEOP|nr:jg14241 [Pararge aegeria aegeria]